MKQPTHFFNLEAKKNKAGEHRIFFNLSYGEKEFSLSNQTAKYTPLRISTKWSIKKEYWNDKPTYRANKTYVSKFGVDLNNELAKIEKIAYSQLFNFRNTFEREPRIIELKQLVFEKLNRSEKLSIDVAVIDYITKSVETRTNIEITSQKRWSINTGKQYTNLKNHIENYQKTKGIILTFGKLTGEVFMDFFKEINDLNKKETGVYYAHNTIAKENKHFRALLNCANEDGISIGFTYSKKEYFIKRREIKNETYLTNEQLETIINTDTSHSKEFTHAKNYLILSSFSGLRIGDMVRIHEIKPEILIHNTKSYFCFTTRIRKSQENKDELIATIPIIQPVRKFLKENENKFPKFPSQQNIRKDIKKFLIHLKFENMFDVNKYFYTIDNVVVSKERLCDIFTPHDCRSTFISHLKDLGVHDEDIEPITHPKHKYTSIVQVYDKTALVGKAVNLINVLKTKKSPFFKY